MLEAIASNIICWEHSIENGLSPYGYEFSLIYIRLRLYFDVLAKNLRQPINKIKFKWQIFPRFNINCYTAIHFTCQYMNKRAVLNKRFQINYIAKVMHLCSFSCNLLGNFPHVALQFSMSAVSWRKRFIFWGNFIFKLLHFINIACIWEY